MLSLTQIENRVLSMEGNRDQTITGVSTNLRADVNECYRELHETHPWFWQETEATVTATSSGATLVLPAAADWIISVYNGSNEPLQPRARKEQRDNRERITNAGFTTVAFDGIDTSTGYYKLNLHPAAEGDYTVVYCARPDELDADADEPVGPDGVADFLVWRTRWLRLQSDEERSHLMSQAYGRSEQHLARLRSLDSTMLRSLEYAIMTPRK